MKWKNGCAVCRLDLTGQLKIVLPKRDPHKPSRVLCLDCWREEREPTE
jgi:hypothetical protein